MNGENTLEMNVFINANESTTVAHEWMNVMLFNFSWQPFSCNIIPYHGYGSLIGYLCQLKLNLNFAFINWHLSRGFGCFEFYGSTISVDSLTITNSFACTELMTFYCTKSCKQYFNVTVKLQMEQLNCLLKWNE